MRDNPVLRRSARLPVGALLLLATVPALAVQPDEVLKDPSLEQRAREISSGLRCLVCQNQSIDESDAPLAKDLRGLVRERLKTGETNGQVRDFVVQRYGEFVLLRPTFGPHTALLWLTPLIVIGLGGVGLFLAMRRRNPTTTRLSEAEQASLDTLLRNEPPVADKG